MNSYIAVADRSYINPTGVVGSRIGIRNNNEVKDITERGNRVSAVAKRELFSNNLGYKVFLLFRNGLIVTLDESPTSFMVNKADKHSFYYSFEMETSSLKNTIDYYFPDKAVNDGKDAERNTLGSFVREIVEHYSHVTPDAFKTITFLNSRVVYSLGDEISDKIEKGTAIYWSDCDVVISRHDPVINNVIHPYSRTMRELKQSCPRLISEADPEGKETLEVQMRLVNIRQEHLYTASCGQVIKINSSKDPSLAPGLHLWTNGEKSHEALHEYCTQAGRYHIPAEKLGPATGFYTMYQDALHIATANIEILTKASTASSVLEEQERKRIEREEELYHKREMRKAQDEIEASQARMLNAEKEHKTVMTAIEERGSAAMKTFEAELKLKHTEEKQQLEMVRAKLEHSVSVFKTISSLLSLCLLTVGLFLKTSK